MDAWPERLLRDKLELIADPDAPGGGAGAGGPDDQGAGRGGRHGRGPGRAAAGAGGPGRDVRAGDRVARRPAGRGRTTPGRTLVYQDAVRDVRVELGEAVTRALAAPLGLVLDSARWLVNDITDRYRECCSRTCWTARPPGPAARPCRCSGCSPWHRPTCTPARAAGGWASSPRRAWPSCSGAGSRCSGRRRPPSRHQVSADAISAQGRRVLPRRVRSPGAAPGSTHRTS